MLTKKNRVWAAAALLTVVTGMTSCLKNDNNVTPQRQTAKVLVINVSNSAVPASFYDNGQKISKDGASIGFNFIAPYNALGGAHTFELKKLTGDSVIATSNATLDSNLYYTHVIFNNPVKSITVLNDLASASQTKINIRCFNLSPAPAADPGQKVDFYIGSEKVDSNRAYMSIGELASSTTFKQFSNFSVNNTVTIKKAGTNETLATNNKLTISAFSTGLVYTLYFAGTPGSTGTDKLITDAIPSYY
ncbi:DUF4397 domain-containing protein [Chitinophaga sp. RAB17]|uniref:DUF4397 domain-containing protein n=1 Tax=Chitinophaga sp. RAB17 TaxID=3233049 RepID=UPI003F9039DD